jgi:hypothetical protein
MEHPAHALVPGYISSSSGSSKTFTIIFHLLF